MCDMASSKVMSTASPTNPDLPLQPSLCSSLSTLLADLQQHNNNVNNNININNLNGGGGGDQSQNLGSMSMEDLLKNMYSAPPGPPEVEAAPHAPMFGGASISREGSFSLPKEIGNKSVDEVWKEIVAGGSDQRRGGAGEGEGEGGDGGIEGMTLEDFLTKAGAVREEDVRGSDQVVTGAGGYGVEAVVDGQYQVGFVNNSNGGGGRVVGLGGGGGRGKRRAVEEPVLDKATQQKQRRMIKNRESAARSRERKQAYTVELESLVTQLEEENARLVREEAEQNKERFKQLMENLIPVVEKRRPPRVLRRVQSLHW